MRLMARKMPFKISYDEATKNQLRAIQAIGVKKGNRLFIGGEEVEL